MWRGEEMIFYLKVRVEWVEEGGEKGKKYEKIEEEDNVY